MESAKQMQKQVASQKWEGCSRNLMREIEAATSTLYKRASPPELLGSSGIYDLLMDMASVTL